MFTALYSKKLYIPIIKPTFFLSLTTCDSKNNVVYISDDWHQHDALETDKAVIINAGQHTLI